MKKAKAEHVVMHAGVNQFHCLNCGISQDFTLPLPIGEWVRQCRAFIKLHKDCKPKVTK